MPYAEVSVNSSFGGRTVDTFSYELPPGISVRPGQAVLVPFGPKILQGIVVEVAETPRYAETRLLAGIIEPPLCLTPGQLAVGLWISRHYLAPLFPSLALWLPPGFERQAEPVITRSTAPAVDIPLTDIEQAVLSSLDAEKSIDQKALEKRFGATTAQKAVRHLLEHSLINRQYRLQALKVKPRMERLARLPVDPDAAQAAAESLSKKAPKQAAIMQRLIDSRGLIRVTELRRDLGDVAAALSALAAKSLLEIIEEESRRAPRLPAAVELPLAHTLTPAQSFAVETVVKAIDKPKGETFLLHGVTGSGKTEVYLHATAHALKRGKQVVVLVPEIALTHQIIERFTARFPGRVAVLHSHLSLGERFDEWQRIRNGEFDVVISRATTSIEKFLALAKNYLKTGGVVIAMKGPDWEKEYSPQDKWELCGVKDYELKNNMGKRALLLFKPSAG